MRSSFVALSALLAGSLGSAYALRPLSPLAIKQWALRRPAGVKRQSATEFPEYTFTQPLDHFADTGVTFEQHYWLSDRHYQPGGPVIVFEAGEGPGDERMPILDTGIIDILAKATNGLGVVLEHRYYGDSIPVDNFTTDSLRWLTNEQAAADSANFIANVSFPNITEDITAPGTPWIYYGGSYGGARAAHMRVLYPDIVYGAIASSGVVHATLDDWYYFDIIRESAPADCMVRVAEAIEEVDAFLADNATRQAIKDVFYLGGITYDPDFASALTYPLGDWQELNWDPAQNDTAFGRLCDMMGPLDNATVSTSQGLTIKNATAMFAQYVDETVSGFCPPEEQDFCFGTITNTAYYAQTDVLDTWRTWTFQVCIQWGFFMTPPPDPTRPRIISNLLTVEYAHLICNLSFAPGEHYAIPALPDVESVNKLGGYNIAADRLAIIDGIADPWRGDCPHSPDPAAHPREDTTLRPFKLILNGSVHHWDENGLADPSAEPAFIQQIHQQEVDFVKAWLKDFKPPSKA